jgi:hypothetical protein
MKVRLVFVPPGGGEADYSLTFDLPSIPQPGDYISITRPDTLGTSDFIVRRTWWYLDYPDNALYETEESSTTGSVKQMVVECEYALGPHPSDEHRRESETYEGIREFDNSTY